ncbi:hypothetical protein Tco_0946238 [Tanacetum coccineum]
MHANKSFNRNPANHRLYHALTEALIEDENAMDKGVDDTVQAPKDGLTDYISASRRAGTTPHREHLQPQAVPPLKKPRLRMAPCY